MYEPCYTRTLSAFPCGRIQHVRCMHYSIVTMIQSVLEFRFTHVIPHSGLSGYISGNISAFVTGYLLESSLVRLKMCAVFKVFKEGNGLISSAACVFSSPMKENKKSTNVFAQTFPS